MHLLVQGPAAVETGLGAEESSLNASSLALGAPPASGHWILTASSLADLLLGQLLSLSLLGLHLLLNITGLLLLLVSPILGLLLFFNITTFSCLLFGDAGTMSTCQPG